MVTSPPPRFSGLHILAAVNGHEGVEALLYEGVDPNIRDSQGYTPLMTAAEAGDPHILGLLLGAGADPKAENKDGLTAAVIAERNRPVDRGALLPATPALAVLRSQLASVSAF